MESAKCASVRSLFAAAFAAILMTVCWCMPALADDAQKENAAVESTQFAGGNLGSHTTDVVLGIADDATKAIDSVDKQAKKDAVVEKALKKARKESSATDYFIAVDLDAKRTMIFKWAGEDWNLEKYWLCSVGAPESPTVTGTFEIGGRGESFSQDGYTCYWYTEFDGPYLFHSVKYNEGTYDVLDGRLGEEVSEGCVRLKIKNAKWIHDNIPSGTRVIVYE